MLSNLLKFSVSKGPIFKLSSLTPDPMFLTPGFFATLLLQKYVSFAQYLSL